jgi:hypothetical protein
MEPSKIEHGLNQLSSMEDGEQLRQLELLIAAITPSLATPELCRALFGIFERFPDHDGYGGFWTILHLLEKCPDYEQHLLDSVRRQPTEFNLCMVNRMINGGISRIGSVELIDLLTSVAEDAHASKDARRLAQDFLQYQRSREGNAQ